MTDLEEIKAAIAATTRDEELASSTCCEVEAYTKLWPSVFLVNDWDIWNGSSRALKLQVIRWLENEDAPYDFFQIRTGFGIVGFKDHEAAKQFETRWSGQTHVTPSSDEDWNPHPLRSTFEPIYAN